MSTSVIDLPENLQPITLLQAQEIQSRLTDRSRRVVSRCQGVRKCNQQEYVDQVAKEAEELWQKYGDSFGHTVAFLWLADLFWRNGELQKVLDYSKTALEHLPQAPLSAYAIPKVVAHYMRGLTYHTLGRLLKVPSEYEESLESFRTARDYYQRIGDGKQAGHCEEVSSWIERLIEYISDLRLYPLAITALEKVLVYPWRLDVQGKYALAELRVLKSRHIWQVRARPCIHLTATSCIECTQTPSCNPIELTLTKPVTTTSPFLRQRSRPWRWLEYAKIDGYQVKARVRLWGLDDVMLPFDLQTANLDANPEDLVLPSGRPYQVFKLTDQPSITDLSMGRGDYLLAWSASTPMPKLLALPPHEEIEDVIVFERDQEGRVHWKGIESEQRILGQASSTSTVDFVLRPT